MTDNAPPTELTDKQKITITYEEAMELIVKHAKRHPDYTRGLIMLAIEKAPSIEAVLGLIPCTENIAFGTKALWCALLDTGHRLGVYTGKKSE